MGRGPLTQCWLVRPDQWWIQSKGTFQQLPYLFLLAASAVWQWCLVAAQMHVWRFPHTRIPRNHKTHLLTLNWHTWEGFPSGNREQESAEEEECRRERRIEQKAKIRERVDVWWILTKYEKLSFDVPIPLWSTSTWTISVLSCADCPVIHTSLGKKKIKKREWPPCLIIKSP